MQNGLSGDALIRTENLHKHFDSIRAVDGISLSIPKGKLVSLLGPNGAGKSTMIRMLTTVLKPTSGALSIGSMRLPASRDEIRKIIGVCPQESTFMDALTAEENVIFVARMHGYSKEVSRQLARQMLEKLGIAGRTDKSKNFSGGMKRRLNLAMALVHRPQVMFLDEPSAGLDPQARRVVWDFIRDQKGHGNTIILTTHDMVEADVLSDYVYIIDQGKIIAEGTPNALKEQFGQGNALEIQFRSQEEAEVFARKIRALHFVSSASLAGEMRLFVSFSGGMKNFVKILKEGTVSSIEEVQNLELRQTTLEDVFLHLTGRRLRD